MSQNWLRQALRIPLLEQYPNRSTQEALIKKYAPETNDPIERSLSQYRCQQAILNVFRRGLLSVLGLVSIPVVFSFAAISFFSGRQNKVKSDDLALNLSTYGAFETQELVSRFRVVNARSGFRLTRGDLLLWFRALKKAPLSPYFFAKALYFIARYRFAWRGEKAILTCAEFNFCSSIMTQWCRDNGVLHINLMHGERVFDLRDAFSSFDEFHVWDEHYINTFVRLHVEAAFVVSFPVNWVGLREWSQNHESKVGKAVFKYYLQIEEVSHLMDLRSVLTRLSKKCRVVVRPHPKFQSAREMTSFFKGIEVEDPRAVGIQESLAEADLVSGLYSTVLFQAQLMGKSIYLDDVTFPQLYERIIELGYVLEGRSQRLSELINEESPPT